MPVSDSTPAMVEVVYSNIGQEWVASLFDEEKEIVGVRAPTRADALRRLADMIDADN